MCPNICSKSNLKSLIYIYELLHSRTVPVYFPPLNLMIIGSFNAGLRVMFPVLPDMLSLLQK